MLHIQYFFWKRNLHCVGKIFFEIQYKLETIGQGQKVGNFYSWKIAVSTTVEEKKQKKKGLTARKKGNRGNQRIDAWKETSKRIGQKKNA